MRRYFGRKLVIYLLTFWVAATIDWMIPRFMPGDPVQSLLSRYQVSPEARRRPHRLLQRAVRARPAALAAVPELLGAPRSTATWAAASTSSAAPGHRRDHGRRSRTRSPCSIPAILLSWWRATSVGAIAARRKVLDNTRPAGRRTSSRRRPTCGSRSCSPGSSRSVLGIFPISGGYSFALEPTLSAGRSSSSLLAHWFLPFLSLFLVMFGGWAIGMRNMIIYELESDYSRYLAALGAPTKLVRRYAFRNAVLPQITGLALALGVIVAGALVTEIVFSYPGIGKLLLAAVQNQDYFLLQGIFLFIIIGVLIANFIVDIAYVIVDPRTRVGMPGRRHERHEPPLDLRPRRRRRSDRRRARRESAAARPAREILYFALRSRKVAHRGSTVARRMLVARDRRPRSCDPATRTRSSARSAVAARRRVVVRDDDVRPGRVRAVRLRPRLDVHRRRLLGGGIAAVIGMTIGFVAGYRGGVVDEVLSMLTNIVLVIPTLALLHRRHRLPPGARALRGGALHRAHVVAVGGPGDPRPDVLAQRPASSSTSPGSAASRAGG